MAQRQSVSVAAAIVDDVNRVLLVHRTDNGYWEPSILRAAQIPAFSTPPQTTKLYDLACRAGAH